MAEQLASLPRVEDSFALPLMSVAVNGFWRAITRREVTEMVRCMARAAGQWFEGLGTHAMRVGAATSLAHAGASDRLIMAAGRWRSLAFLVYIRDNLADAVRITAALSPKEDIAAALVL
jgi:hypothetical protein